MVPRTPLLICCFCFSAPRQACKCVSVSSQFNVRVGASLRDFAFRLPSRQVLMLRIEIKSYWNNLTCFLKIEMLFESSVTCNELLLALNSRATALSSLKEKKRVTCIFVLLLNELLMIT